MKRLLVLAMAVSLGSCAFAQKHPGVTIGLVAGGLGFGTCELAVAQVGSCAVVGGGAGLLIGGITGIVTLIADTNAHDLPSDDVDTSGISRRRRIAPPPGPYLPPEPNPLPPSATPASPPSTTPPPAPTPPSSTTPTAPAPVDAGVPAPSDAAPH